MKILNQKQIEQKIRRLSVEILERNWDAESIILAGINENGYLFGEYLAEELRRRSDKPIHLTRLRVHLNDHPSTHPSQLQMLAKDLEDKVVIIVDDVTNTGRALFYALHPFLSIKPQKLEIAVLVDRKHKKYPIHPDYVGMSLATTLREHIEIQILSDNEMAAFLM